MALNELVKRLDLPEDELDRQVREALGDQQPDAIGKLYEESVKNFEPDQILTGKILSKAGDDAIIDIGYKSEGIITRDQFDNWEDLEPGDTVEVLLEAVEDESGLV